MGILDSDGFAMGAKRVTGKEEELDVEVLPGSRERTTGYKMMLVEMRMHAGFGLGAKVQLYLIPSQWSMGEEMDDGGCHAGQTPGHRVREYSSSCIRH